MLFAAATQADIMRGVLGRKSPPIATVFFVLLFFNVCFKKPIVYALHTSFVILLASPRAPLVPKATPFKFIIALLYRLKQHIQF